jgi:hypothetical protein
MPLGTRSMAWGASCASPGLAIGTASRRPSGYFTSTAGHGAYNHDPDQTYNVRDFQNNEMRTMRMAQEMFQQIQSFTASPATRTWSDIETTVLEFVRTGQAAGNAAGRWDDNCVAAPLTCNERAADNRRAAELRDKSLTLQSSLVSAGLLAVGDLNTRTGRLRYDVTEAQRRRETNLRGLSHGANRNGRPAFVGVLLPGD